MAEKKDKDIKPYSFSASQLLKQEENIKIVSINISSDVALSGGIPLGATVLVGGKPKSGKTTWVLQCAANAQEQFGAKVFYCNIEGRIGKKVLSQIKNIDLDNMTIVSGPPIYDKDGVTVIGNKKMTSQQWWNKIGELITSELGCVIIVDSVSALSEEAELAEGMGYFSRGGLQKLEAQFVRQYGDLVVQNKVLFLIISQVQANTSGYGELIQMKCGNAIKHLADGIIFVKSVEKWKPNNEGKVLGQDMICRIDCSPLGSPYIECKIPLRFGIGLDEELDLLTNCVNWGMIKASGARYVLPFNKNTLEYTEVPDNKEAQDTGFVKAHGEEAARKFLVDNPVCMKVLNKKIRELVL